MSTSLRNSSASTVVPGTQLYALLNDEIASLRSEATRGGWNLWALSAALVAALLAAAELWSRVTLDVPLLCRWIVVLAIGAFAIVPAFGDTAFRKAAEGQAPRMRIANEYLHTHRRPSLVYAASCAVLAVLTRLGREGVPAFVFILAETIFGIGALVWLAAFAASFSEIPVALEQEGDRNWKVQAVVLLVYYVTIAIVIAGFAQSIPQLAPGRPNPELRFAAYVVTVGLLVVLMARQARQDPVVRELISLRRRIALGQIADAEALRATEIALLGLDPGARLEHHLKRTNQLFRLASVAYQTAVIESRLATEDTLLLQDPATALSPEKYSEAKKRLRKRVRRIAKSDRVAQRHFTKVQSRLQEFDSEFLKLTSGADLGASAAALPRLLPIYQELGRAVATGPKALAELSDWLQEANAALNSAASKKLLL